jgi:hypothetical protein
VKLITAHRILIAAGIAFFLFYAAFQWRLYGRTGALGPALQAVVSAAVAVGLVIYFRSLRNWGRRR